MRGIRADHPDTPTSHLMPLINMGDTFDCSGLVGGLKDPYFLASYLAQCHENHPLLIAL